MRSVASLVVDRARLASRAMQVAILLVFAAGVLRGNVSVVVNAVLGLGVTLLPALLERDYRIHLGPRLTLWITAAVLLHAVGMLGLYDSVWWWDHLTHTLSATVIAAVGYVTARVVDVHYDAVYLPPRFMAVYVVLFTMAVGVYWEVLEFAVRVGAPSLGLNPMLVQYGLSDTVVDLVFDGVGGLLVAVFGTRELGGLVETLVARFSGPGSERR